MMPTGGICDRCQQPIHADPILLSVWVAGDDVGGEYCSVDCLLRSEHSTQGDGADLVVRGDHLWELLHLARASTTAQEK